MVERVLKKAVILIFCPQHKDNFYDVVERHFTIRSVGQNYIEYVVEVQIIADDNWDNDGTIFGIFQCRR